MADGKIKADEKGMCGACRVCIRVLLPCSPHQGPIPYAAPAPACRPRGQSAVPPTCCDGKASSVGLAPPTAIKMNTFSTSSGACFIASKQNVFILINYVFSECISYM